MVGAAVVTNCVMGTASVVVVVGLVIVVLVVVVLLVVDIPLTENNQSYKFFKLCCVH